MTDMASDWLQEIKDRASRACPPPWEVWVSDDMGACVETPDGDIMVGFIGFQSHEPAMNDADFIAHAREDIPRLIEEVERLRLILSGQMKLPLEVQ